MAPSSHFFHSHRLKLHYWDFGGEGNPPLILVHGTQDHARNWDDFAAEFVATHHVLALDLRGHGDSAWAPGAMYGFPEFTLDLAAFANVVKERPLTFVGHSLGGVVVMHYAGAFPETVAKIVNIEGWGPPPAPKPRNYQERLRTWVEKSLGSEHRQQRKYATFEDAVARMKEANPHLSDRMAEHLTCYGTDRDSDGSLIWKFDPFLRNFPPIGIPPVYAGELFGAITCPVLFLRGGESWAADLNESGQMAMVQNSRMVTIPGAGHWVHHDQFEAVIQETKAFLGEF